MPYTLKNLILHVKQNGAAQAETSERYPILISPHEDDESVYSIFALDEDGEVLDVIDTVTCPCDRERLAEDFWDLADKRTVKLLYESERDIPKTVQRYYNEHIQQGQSENLAWAIAWSRYCKYKNPSSPHCKKKASQYLRGRGKRNR